MGDSQGKNEITARNENNLAITNYMHGAMNLGASLTRDIYLYEIDIVGTRYVGGVDELIKSIKLGDRITFLREPENAYDERAVMALDEKGRKLGYIPRMQNAIMSALMDAGKQFYGIVSARIESSEGRNGRFLQNAISVKLYMREFASADGLLAIPRQGALGSFAVADLRFAEVHDEKSICGISAIKVINGEERGFFHHGLVGMDGEEDALLLEDDKLDSMIRAFDEFVGQLPIVCHGLHGEKLKLLEEAYGVILGKAFSNFVVNTKDMAFRHVWSVKEYDLDSLIERLEIKTRWDSQADERCKKTLALYRWLEEVEKRQPKKLTVKEAKRQIKPGLYADENGTKYEMLDVVKNNADESAMVLYRPEKKSKELLVCDASWWIERDARDDTPRFWFVTGEE